MQTLIVTACACFSILLGLTVAAGWVGEFEAIVTLNEGWITMKFTTALYFILGGVQLLAMQRPLRQHTTIGLLVLSWCVWTMLVLMSLTLLSHITGWIGNLNQLVYFDRPRAATAVPGRPSLVTTLGFLLLAIAGLVRIIRQENINKLRTGLGVAILVLGLVCTLGYAIGNPWLIYFVPGFCSAMALHTAVGFSAVGLGLALLRCDYKDPKEGDSSDGWRKSEILVD